MTTPSSPTFRQLLERSERVFPSHPQVTRYFPAAASEAARKRLMRSIDRGDGPGLIVGAAGTGKSLLLQVLAAQYQERFDVILLACARICTRRALLQTLLFELGLPYQQRDEGQLRLSLLDHLLSAEDCPTGLLLLVDEAQSLSIALLDELRIMTNLVRGGAPRVRLILAGAPELDESFASPELESLSQRLAARCYLAPFNRAETSQFVRAQLAASGVTEDALFANEALDAVFEATDGVPRLINQLCDRALGVADTENRTRLDRQVIQAAWSDLQQLPAPWDAPASVPAATRQQENVVEFGGLCSGEFEDSEPTELDLVDAEEEISAKPVTVNPAHITPATANSGADPFTEAFEEEEIVLDNFASWGEMFRRDAPRVENHRDRNFAALVQAVLDKCGSSTNKLTSPIPPLTVQGSTNSVDELVTHPTSQSEHFLCVEHDADHAEEDEYEIEDSWPPTNTDTQTPKADCPPLRLAVVNEPTPLKPIPLVLPKGRTASLESKGYAPVVPKEIDPDDDWTKNPPPRIATQKWSTRPLEPGQPPILIIDEETVAKAAGKSPVRREEYRQLFTRLRHGT